MSPLPPTRGRFPIVNNEKPPLPSGQELPGKKVKAIV